MSKSQIWVNGQQCRELDAEDRGLLYGDGFFTTMRVEHGKPSGWQWHWRRLQACAEVLGFPALQEAQLLAEISQAAGEQATLGMRLTLTRGKGGRGYSPPTTIQITRVLQCFELPAHYEVWREQGIEMAVANRRLAPQMTDLVGLKTLNRLEQVLLKSELAQYPLDDLVVLEQNGAVVEATAANLFWRHGEQWYTPALTRTGVHGTLRAQLLAHNPATKQGDFPLEHLLAAEECFVCNALLGCAPVRRIDKLEFAHVGRFKGLTQEE